MENFFNFKYLFNTKFINNKFHILITEISGNQLLNFFILFILIDSSTSKIKKITNYERVDLQLMHYFLNFL